jgi:hypothetical protein
MIVMFEPEPERDTLDWAGRSSRPPTSRKECGKMIVLGVILLVVGFLLSIPVLWTIGIILALVGVVFAIAGATGRAVGGRAHWY